MPWQWLQRDSNDPDEWTGFIEQGVHLEGNLSSTGTFRVNSTVKGNLTSERTLMLGENAEVEGELEARVVIIAGKFKGTVRATEQVEIQPNGVVRGDVYSPCLSIAAGAIFSGTCHMLGDADGTHKLAIPIRATARP
ncbi:MAG: polymer-forming cytoskeletal protein [Candidatus Acidiferrales bacterium]